MASLRFTLIFLVIAITAVTWTDGQSNLSASEKLKIHKEWLDKRRAQLKSVRPTGALSPPVQSQNSSNNSYFRRIIKFKTKIEPESSNDISFMPDQRFPAGPNNDVSSYKYDLITSSEESAGADFNISTTPPNVVVETRSMTNRRTTEEPETFDSMTDQVITQSATASPLATTTMVDISEDWTTTSTEAVAETTTPITVKTPPIGEDRKTHRRPPSLWNERNRRPLNVGNELPKAEIIANATTLPRQVTTNAKESSSKKNPSKRAIWGSWGPWSECSRSCGGGVRRQERTCRNRTNATIASSECIGFYRRYRICNDQACPEGQQDFRAQQCSFFNNHTFKSKQYTWEPFIKADAECELNCKPLKLNYFARLNRTVIDGTPCSKPPESSMRKNFQGRAVCVDGTCKAVHSTGVIVGAYSNNGAVRCGHMVCRPVTGIFTQTNLSNGYHNVATIPIGASNITITELKNTINFLVLKSDSGHFIINGDFSITPSGIYESAGSVFDYKRIDTPTSSPKTVDSVREWITTLGPLTEPVHLMVLIQHHHNPGIKYEYLLPINTNSASEEEDSVSGESDLRSLRMGTGNETQLNLAAPANGRMRRRKYAWKVVKFAPCSKTCGGGTQSPIIKCVREGSTKISAPKKCVNLNKPIVNENQLRCNTQPCPAYWKVSDWSPCNCGQNEEQSTQTRVIRCVQELTNERVIQVHEGACVEDAPDVDQSCDCHKSRQGEKTPAPNRPSSIIRHPTNRGHHQNSSVTTMVQRRHKKAGMWLTSSWMSQCSTECGIGVQYRSIFCDRSSPNTDRCDQRFTPDTSRQCTSESKCMVGDWFTGPWSPCSGDCFNLTKTRTVFCIRDEVVVNNRECGEIDTKPLELEFCELADVQECTPQWHTSEWTACTKSCNEGTQRRVVKCLEPNLIDKRMRESDNCLYTDRPVAFRTCNPQKCDEEGDKPQVDTYDPKVDLIQNDVVPECEDEFPNCELVVKARLCHHSYYHAHCCGTCRKLQ